NTAADPEPPKRRLLKRGLPPRGRLLVVALGYLAGGGAGGAGGAASGAAGAAGAEGAAEGAAGVSGGFASPPQASAKRETETASSATIYLDMKSLRAGFVTAKITCGILADAQVSSNGSRFVLERRA